MRQPSRLPIATLILIVANIAAAFALVWQPDLILDFGFNPQRPTFQTVFTGLFIHSNLFHLFGNMLFLAAVGAAVELATGTLRFIVVYFVSGLAGVGLHALLAPKNLFEPHPLVGASGCIAGCAAYYGVRYLTLKVPLAPRVGVPVAGVLVVWIGLQVLGAFKTIGDSAASTAFWAHLGGFAAGLTMSFVFRAPDLGLRRLGHDVLDKMNERGPAAAIAAAMRHLESHPDDPKALRQLAEAHSLMDNSEGETAALVRMIDLLPDQDIGVFIARLAEINELRSLPPMRRMVIAERIKTHNVEASRSLLTSVVEGPPEESQRPEAMLALAGLDRESDPERSDEILSQMQAEYPLHPAVDLAKAKGWIA